MEALILQRQKDLQNARIRVQELERHLTAHRSEDQEQMIEVITSGALERQTYMRLQSTAQHEILFLARPPFRISTFESPQDEDEEIERQMKVKGVRYRTVVDASFLAHPGTLDRLRREIESKEEIRVFSHLPLKMCLIDRRTALLPLNLQEPNSPALLVRSSALLDALHTLFETFWDRSAPLSFDHKGMHQVGRANSQLSKEVGEVLSLLNVGMNDKAIALELKISTRTLERRIVELMQKLDSRTRFQAGWLAAQRFSALSQMTTEFP
jgi:DNA-binding CsgD family transcriptional regulator